MTVQVTKSNRKNQCWNVLL